MAQLGKTLTTLCMLSTCAVCHSPAGRMLYALVTITQYISPMYTHRVRLKLVLGIAEICADKRSEANHF